MEQEDIPDCLEGSEGPINPKKMAIEESKRPKRKSKVWEYFEMHTSPPRAVCKLCNKALSAKQGGHLKHHMDRCLTRSSDDRKQGSKSASLKNINFEVDEIHRALAMMTVIDEQPFNVVEDNGFSRLMAVACPGTQRMCKQTVKRETMLLYVKEREKTRELLAMCLGKICLTSSTWKSDLNNRYNCVTAHFIDREWRLQKRMLRFKLIPPPYDSVTIGDEIALCMVQWNIEHKVFSIALQDLSTDDCVASIIKARLASKKYLPCKGLFFHLGCCSQVLNSIVQAALDLIAHTTEKVRLGIKYVKHSWKSFYVIAKSLNLGGQRKLFVDCPAKWNTTYDMLQLAVCYRDAFSHLDQHDMNFRHNLSEDEWEAVSQVCKFLKVFYEVTYTLSETKHPTCNLYFKLVWKIYNRLLDVLKGPDNFMTPMVREMQPKLTQYWSDYSLVLSCAAILDPRYKIKFIEYCYMKLYGSVAESYVGIVIKTLHSLLDEYMQKPVSVCTTSVVSTDSMSSDRHDSDGFEDYKTFQSMFGTRSQLDMYLEEPNHEINSELDVLEFWNLNSVKYPELSRMARDVLAIQVSTVGFENAFCMGHPLISPCRSSLKSKTIQALMCLQDWMQATSKGNSISQESNYDSSASSSGDEDDY